jgi:hypothetical protein
LGIVALFFALSLTWYETEPTLTELDVDYEAHVTLGKDREAKVRDILSVVRNWCLGGIIPVILAALIGIKAMVGEHRRWLAAYVGISLLGVVIMIMDILLVGAVYSTITAACEAQDDCYPCSDAKDLPELDDCADEAWADDNKRCLYRPQNSKALCDVVTGSAMTTIVFMSLMTLVAVSSGVEMQPCAC